MREQSDILDYVPDAAPQSNQVSFSIRNSLHAYLSGGGRQQTVDQFEGSGFARAAAPQQYKSLPALDFQTKPREHLRARYAVADITEFNDRNGVRMHVRKAYRSSP